MTRKRSGEPAAGLAWILSSTIDLTALVLFFPDYGGALLPFFWVPGERLDDREERDKVPYRTWASQKLLYAPPGRAVDKFAIAGQLAELASAYDIQGIAYDRYRIEDLLKILDHEGIELPLVPFGQGYVSMGPACDEFERRVLDRELVHGGHPVLTWNVANAVVTHDPAGNKKVAKDKARRWTGSLPPSWP